MDRLGHFSKLFKIGLGALLYALCLIVSNVFRPPSGPIAYPEIGPNGSSDKAILLVNDHGQLFSREKTDREWTLLDQLRFAKPESIAQKIDAIVPDEVPVHWVGEGLGASILLNNLDIIDASNSSVELRNPHGIEAFDLLGNRLIDRPLRHIQATILEFMDRWVPFSWVLDYPYGENAWSSRYRAYYSFDGGFFAELSHNAEVTVADPQVSDEARWFSELLGLAGNEAMVHYDHLLHNLKTGDGSLWSIHWTGAGLIALSTLISEDLACIGSGILVSQEVIAWSTAILGCVLGIYLGDLLIYLAGRFIGERVVRNRLLRWMISEEALVRSERWFEKSGVWVLIASRFMPGTRVPVYFAAGVLRAKLWMVSFILLGAAVVWVPVLVSIAYLVGERVVHLFEQYESLAVWILLATIIVIFFISHQLLPLATYRGRRLFYARIQRWVRWEFWQAKVLYIPVAAYILWLGLRYRSLSLCTLANPMAPLGGLIDESKSDILKRLHAAGVPVSDFIILKSGMKISEYREEIAQAQQAWRQDFPIVLKPDVGERGKGVQIIKNEGQLESVLPTIQGDYILQKFVGGIEFGVLYERLPGETHGVISSITAKHYTHVLGDGEKDLEHLILSDPRAVFHAETFFTRYSERLYEVPKKGEKIPLAEIGTHARGSLFLDAGALHSAALEARFNEFCPNIDGYYLGRFDVKVPNESALKAGKDISILELNLLTSEPTHMYDPSHSVFYAWKMLLRHWRISFEIGHQLRKQGMQPPGTFSVLNVIYQHYLG